MADRPVRAVGDSPAEAFFGLMSVLQDGPARATPHLKLRYLGSKSYGIPGRAELARFLGVSRGTLGRWTSGKQKPSAASRGRIEAAYWRRVAENAGLARAQFKITSSPDGGIEAGGRIRGEFLVGDDDAHKRDWTAAANMVTEEDAEEVLADFIDIDSGLDLGGDGSNAITFAPGYNYTIAVL